ncbi:MAG: hypothetical protein HY673_07700 [Chloroflexi bacterium]|nr:hypothetical protein [Chloroflexota bacterium]
MHHHRHEYREVILEYDGAVKLEPGDPEVYNYCGVAHVKLGEYAKAVSGFDQALAPDRCGIEAYAHIALIGGPNKIWDCLQSQEIERETKWTNT